MNLDYKALPASPDTERLILGAVLGGQADLADLDGLLAGDDFSIEKHRKIWRGALELHKGGRTVDRVTIAQWLIDHELLESVDGLSYLLSLDQGMPAIPNIPAYARLVHDKAVLRRTIFACHETMQRCYLATDPPADLIAHGERVLRDLGQSTSAPGFETYGDIIASAGGVGQITKNLKPGLQTPWAKLNETIGGLRAGEVTVLAARPSVGKSAMAQQLCHYIAETQGVGCVTFSLEMSKQQLLMRALASYSGVPSNFFRGDQMSPNQRLQFAAAASRLAKLPVWFDDRARIGATIIQLIRQWKAQHHELGLVCIDHVNLMRSGLKNENRNQELDSLTSDLKSAAKDNDLHVLELCQLNRGSERDKRTQDMSDLRDSGGIEQNADNIFFLSLELSQDRKQMLGVNDAYAWPPGRPRPVDLRVTKQRDGERFRIVELWFTGWRYSFTETEQAEGVNAA